MANKDFHLINCAVGGRYIGGSTSTMTSSIRQRFLHRESTLSSTVFNASDIVSVPTSPSSFDHEVDDTAAREALMTSGAGRQTAAAAALPRSASAHRARPRPPRHGPVDTSSDLIQMHSFRYDTRKGSEKVVSG